LHKRWHGIKDYGIGGGSLSLDGIDEGSLDSDDTEDGITDLRSGCCCCWRLAVVVVVVVIGLNGRSQNSTELVYLFIVKIFRRAVGVKKRSAPTFCQPFWPYTAGEKSC
jgi:hypothetical protein